MENPRGLFVVAVQWGGVLDDLIPYMTEEDAVVAAKRLWANVHCREDEDKISIFVLGGFDETHQAQVLSLPED